MDLLKLLNATTETELKEVIQNNDFFEAISGNFTGSKEEIEKIKRLVFEQQINRSGATYELFKQMTETIEVLQNKLMQRP